MTLYARIYEGTVQELFETELDITTLFHPELQWVEVKKGQDIAEGWLWTADGGFSPPPAPSAEVLAQEAKDRRDGYLEFATMKIAPLQDAVDLGEATDSEAAQLKAWKTYRVQLSRLETQSGFPRDITWPTVPD